MFFRVASLILSVFIETQSPYTPLPVLSQACFRSLLLCVCRARIRNRLQGHGRMPPLDPPMPTRSGQIRAGQNMTGIAGETCTQEVALGLHPSSNNQPTVCRRTDDPTSQSPLFPPCALACTTDTSHYMTVPLKQHTGAQLCASHRTSIHGKGHSHWSARKHDAHAISTSRAHPPDLQLSSY